ncbi:MAG TPA: tryptophan 7-halogenase [Planctomycetaceae bacterium]|nr:tryptophan 7-halogenase [Planctomycetaceae bacterium]
MRLDAEIAVIGSGFGGSLTALLLDRIGRRPMLVDRGSHPRFAIGESSTPIANLVLRDLALRYGLPRLVPLAKYGTWQATYPDVVCGIKRGFSYFQHVPGEPFAPQADHANELLVAASGDEQRSDTHWLRSDVDAFLVREVQAAGIPYFDRTDLTVLEHSPDWQLTGVRDGAPLSIRAKFLVDATGEGGFLERTLGFGSRVGELRTSSRGIFGHFTGLRPWHDALVAAGGRVEDHPFCCDHAALHQVLDEGWMWQLRFNNGVTSAGFALDAARSPLDPQIPPEQEWNRLLRKYPAIAEQFAGARLVQPESGLRRSGRMQRLAGRIVGRNWALLPHTAGFIDPLHSTGIAHTMCGIERLIEIVAGQWEHSSLTDELRAYEQSVRRELALIDQLVHGCYVCFGRFPLLVSFAMLYFAAATSYEHRRVKQQLRPGAAFLDADDPALRAAVEQGTAMLRDCLPGADGAAGFEQAIARTIAPFNVARLCDPGVRNMYRYTAVPDGP